MKDTNIIYAYTLKQAIEDVVLVEILKSGWEKLSGGKPNRSCCMNDRNWEIASVYGVC